MKTRVKTKNKNEETAFQKIKTFENGGEKSPFSFSRVRTLFQGKTTEQPNFQFLKK